MTADSPTDTIKVGSDRTRLCNCWNKELSPWDAVATANALQEQRGNADTLKWRDTDLCGSSASHQPL